nr:hypothetical protein [Opitutaceae bacterium]
MCILSLTRECRRWFAERPLRGFTLLFGVLAVLAYSAMPAEELTFDNSFIIGDDTRLRAFSVDSIIQIVNRDYWWPSLSSSLYRPLTTFSFWFEYSFLGYGTSPLGYQLGNLLLHGFNAILVFHLGRRLGLRQTAAALVTGIFLLHPIATEVVANIVGRSDLFATAAVLGGLIFYFDALERTDRRGRFLGLAAAGLCGLAGVMAKESAIMLPALIGWHGLLRMRELRQGAVEARTWLYDAIGAAITFLPCVVFVLVTRSIFSDAPGVNDHPFMDNPLMPEGFLVTRVTALGVWGMQIGQLFMPLSLSSDYSFNAIPVANLEEFNRTAWWGVGTGAVFLALLAFISSAGRRIEGLAFAAGAYVIAMLPTSNMIIKIGSIRADRFHYLPSVFFW